MARAVGSSRTGERFCLLRRQGGAAPGTAAPGPERVAWHGAQAIAPLDLHSADACTAKLQAETRPRARGVGRRRERADFKIWVPGAAAPGAARAGTPATGLRLRRDGVSP